MEEKNNYMVTKRQKTLKKNKKFKIIDNETNNKKGRSHSFILNENNFFI